MFTLLSCCQKSCLQFFIDCQKSPCFQLFLDCEKSSCLQFFLDCQKPACFSWLSEIILFLLVFLVLITRNCFHLLLIVCQKSSWFSWLSLRNNLVFTASWLPEFTLFSIDFWPVFIYLFLNWQKPPCFHCWLIACNHLVFTCFLIVRNQVFLLILNWQILFCFLSFLDCQKSSFDQKKSFCFQIFLDCLKSCLLFFFLIVRNNIIFIFYKIVRNHLVLPAFRLSEIILILFIS